MKYYQATRHDNRFKVTGGPGIDTEMGWHITNEHGSTMAVSCDHGFSLRLNNMENLIQLIRDTYTKSVILEELEGEDYERAAALFRALEIE